MNTMTVPGRAESLAGDDPETGRIPAVTRAQISRRSRRAHTWQSGKPRTVVVASSSNRVLRGGEPEWGM